MKAHIFRELVNDLRDIATQWHGSQQLRERISGRLRQDVSINEDPANDGWIPWSGGKCPVSRYTIVEIMFRGGHITRTYADGIFWMHFGLHADIVAYRVVTEALNDWT